MKASIRISLAAACFFVASCGDDVDVVATGQYPQSPVVTPDGRFVYVSNAISNSISAYGIDRTSGVLSSLSGSPYLVYGSPWVYEQPRLPTVSGAVLDPVGRFLFLTLINIAAEHYPSERFPVILQLLGRFPETPVFAE